MVEIENTNLNIFITDSSDKFYEEKSKRESIYKTACDESHQLWENYEKSGSKEDMRMFFIKFKELDILYKDWQDNVKYEYTNE